MMSRKQEFLEEYKILCKKYRIYLFAESDSFTFPISLAVVGKALQDDIIDEHISDIKGSTK